MWEQWLVSEGKQRLEATSFTDDCNAPAEHAVKKIKQIEEGEEVKCGRVVGGGGVCVFTLFAEKNTALQAGAGTTQRPM